MNTLTKKLRTGCIGLTVVATCMAALPVYAQDAVQPQESTQSQQTTQPQQTVTVHHSASKQENIGVVTGLAIGAAAGGPVGAIFGAAAGAWIGDRYHKQVVAKQEMAANLDKSEADRTKLAQNVTELNGSLAHEQEKSEQLDLALSH